VQSSHPRHTNGPSAVKPAQTLGDSQRARIATYTRSEVEISVGGRSPAPKLALLRRPGMHPRATSGGAADQDKRRCFRTCGSDSHSERKTEQATVPQFAS